ncbi:spore germination protein PF [Neobacillus bataviensis]|uniref:Spore germination protein PF n=1 Tax=Neobacillus bataviensis TaxID=220685 RepID=A0A561DC87_9BACI|nr:spore germination protein [Neobacillus bataviensis]TWE00985.1 spore germination protein PF [Neobacillus bataviensis]
MSFNPPVKIDTVSGGVVQFGGALFVSPKNAIKSSHGAGSVNSGAHIVTISGVSSTNTAVTDVVDQPIVQDA